MAECQYPLKHNYIRTIHSVLYVCVCVGGGGGGGGMCACVRGYMCVCVGGGGGHFVCVHVCASTTHLHVQCS